MITDPRELLAALRPLLRQSGGRLALDEPGLSQLARRLLCVTSGATLYETARAILACCEAMSHTPGAERAARQLKEGLLLPVLGGASRAARIEIAGRAMLARRLGAELPTMVAPMPTGVRVGG